jgi:hypothetical protein
MVNGVKGRRQIEQFPLRPNCPCQCHKIVSEYPTHNGFRRVVSKVRQVKIWNQCIILQISYKLINN